MVRAPFLLCLVSPEGKVLGLPHRDALDLDEGVLGQGGDLDAAAGREAAVEVGAVDFVHSAEISQILHENRRLDDVVEGQASLGQNGLQVLQRLVGLRLYTLGEDAGGGVKAELTAAIDGGTGIDSLRIGRGQRGRWR